MAINGFHALFYTTDAAADRAFLRDVIGLRYVASGGEADATEQDWLIFRTPPAEVGVHPAETVAEGEVPASLYFTCDDITATVAELEGRGAEFTGPPQDHGFGIAAYLRLPSGGLLGVYEPRHAVAHSLG